MTSEPLQLDELSDPHVQIMQTYSVRAAAGKSSDEFDGWLERVSSLADFTPDELVKRHGELIALGFLKFEISNADLGLRYQISPRGKNALERALARLAAEEENSADVTEDEIKEQEIAEDEITEASAVDDVSETDADTCDTASTVTAESAADETESTDSEIADEEVASVTSEAAEQPAEIQADEELPLRDAA